MLLSMKAKYGLRAMVRLAREYGGGPVLIADLAAKETLPRKFLEGILLELKQQGMLESKKGKGGGYLLRQRPEDISVGRVVRALDGALEPLPCVAAGPVSTCDDCRAPSTCSIRRLMQEVHLATSTILDATTLRQLAEQEERDLRAEHLPRYHI
jgi:Rrf2 family protein